MGCTPCRGGEPTLTEAEIAELHPQVSHWSILEKGGIKQLGRSFKFKDFTEALAFTNKVGKIAEEVGHHPDIFTGWGKVTVT